MGIVKVSFDNIPFKQSDIHIRHGPFMDEPVFELGMLL